MKKGFTLIELLVVVLIIGILAAVALPQYEKAVEKSRMTEGVTMVRAIANANKVFFLANDRYAESNELNLLDIEVPGKANTTWTNGRLQTANFIYSPRGGGTAANTIALGHQYKGTGDRYTYYIYVSRDEQNRIRCYSYSQATKLQKELCKELDDEGVL